MAEAKKVVTINLDKNVIGIGGKGKEKTLMIDTNKYQMHEIV